MLDAAAFTSCEHIYAIIYPEHFTQLFDTGKDGQYLTCCFHLILRHEAVIASTALILFKVFAKISQEQLPSAYSSFTKIQYVHQFIVRYLPFLFICHLVNKI